LLVHGQRRGHPQRLAMNGDGRRRSSSRSTGDELSRVAVEQRLTGVVPEVIRKHAVPVNGTWFPVRQAFEARVALSSPGGLVAVIDPATVQTSAAWSVVFSRSPPDPLLVQPAKNPEYLTTLLQAVREFRSAFVAFLKLYDSTQDTGLARGLVPAVVPKNSSSAPEIARRQKRVALAAGRAAEAPRLTGNLYVVEGRGRVDPIAVWHSVTMPKPILEPAEIIATCDSMIGQLEMMIARAQASTPPTLNLGALHPLIWGAAAPLWRDGHYRAAVATAAETLIASVKARTGRNDIAETALWQEVFRSDPPAPGKPRLRWPGNQSDRDVKSMTDGLRQFAPGVQMTIRNTAAHGLDELDEHGAVQRLAVLSLLAGWVEECDLVEAEQPAAS
jgi:hypothetical protein